MGVGRKIGISRITIGRLPGKVHGTPEKFENGVCIQKTRQMFSVRTTPEKFENATITGHFGLLFEENSDIEITSLS